MKALLAVQNIHIIRINSHQQRECPEVPGWWLDRDDDHRGSLLNVGTWEHTSDADPSTPRWLPTHETTTTTSGYYYKILLFCCCCWWCYYYYYY